MAVKTFTTGEVLTAADTNTYLNNGGLVYITRIDLGGNTAVNADGIFTSTYNTYEIVISDFRGASAGYLNVNTRSAGSTDGGTNYVYAEGLGGQNIDQVSWRWIYAYNTTDRGNTTVRLQNPLSTSTGTAYQALGGARNSTTSFFTFLSAGQKETQTADDGLRFTHSGGAVAMNGYITILGVRQP